MWPFKRKIQKEPTERDEAFTKFLAEQKKAAAENDAAFADLVSEHQKLRDPYVKLVEGIKKIGGLHSAAEENIIASETGLAEIRNDLNKNSQLPKTGLPQPPINRLNK